MEEGNPYNVTIMHIRIELKKLVASLPVVNQKAGINTGFFVEGELLACSN
jgi:hypothetical protein